jgi:hypothetical protein
LARTSYETAGSPSQLSTCHPGTTDWKDAAHRKCVEHRYKRLIASYLNSVLVSP